MRNCFTLFICAIALFVNNIVCAQDQIDLVAIKEEALNGNMYSQSMLGLSYYNGDNGVELNYVEAVKWFTMAAKQGETYAQYYLAKCYDNGDGVRENKYEANFWYQAAARQGCIDAQFNLGRQYYFGKGMAKDKEAALYWTEQAARAGHVRSQFFLGAIYEDRKEFKEAVKWYKKASDAGFLPAKSSLAVCYGNGTGVKQDYKEAINLLKEAADAGDDHAIFNLGISYLKGWGVFQDIKQGLFWLEKYGPGKENTIGWVLEIEADGGPYYKEAVRWYKRGATSGNNYCKFNLAVCLLNGNGIVQDRNEAIRFFNEVKQSNDAKEMFNGLMDGIQQGKPYPKGRSEYEISLCYLYGIGVEKDIVKSDEWYVKAKDAGCKLIR